MFRDQQSMTRAARIHVKAGTVMQGLQIRHLLIPGGRIVVRTWSDRVDGRGNVPSVLRCDVEGFRRTRDGENPLGIVVSPPQGFTSAAFRRYFIGDHVSTFRTWISSGEFPGIDSDYFSES